MPEPEGGQEVVPGPLRRYGVGVPHGRPGAGGPPIGSTDPSGRDAATLADGADVAAELGGSTNAATSRSARIAPDLATKIIDRLFAAGLQLTHLQSHLVDGALNDEVEAAIEELDLVIRDVRRAVLE